jgi:hypothetical protein
MQVLQLLSSTIVKTSEKWSQSPVRPALVSSKNATVTIELSEVLWKWVLLNCCFRLRCFASKQLFQNASSELLGLFKEPFQKGFDIFLDGFDIFNFNRQPRYVWVSLALRKALF